jgi:hypothetical protein
VLGLNFQPQEHHFQELMIQEKGQHAQFAFCASDIQNTNICSSGFSIFASVTQN